MPRKETNGCLLTSGLLVMTTLIESSESVEPFAKRHYLVGPNGLGIDQAEEDIVCCVCPIGTAGGALRQFARDCC